LRFYFGGLGKYNEAVQRMMKSGYLGFRSLDSRGAKGEQPVDEAFVPASLPYLPSDLVEA
jgi:hypothetical protein